MKTQNLSNDELVKLAVAKAGAERALSLEVIALIREVERRRCYLEMGYGSLFDFVTKALGYEESAALRRISAARLIRELPELEAKIKEGSLNLSSVNQAQTFFRREEKACGKKVSPEHKRRVLAQLENKSARTVKKVLLELAPPGLPPQESSRPVSGTLTEIKAVIDENLRADLEKLKSIMSHKNPYMSYGELLRALADLALKRVESKVPKNSPSTSAVESGRYIPIQLQKKVWQNYLGCCGFIDPATGRRCESRYQLEFHHTIPFAKGGPTSEENLQLFCKAHNQHQGIKDFGASKMRRAHTM
jgi:hypothetical protein